MWVVGLQTSHRKRRRSQKTSNNGLRFCVKSREAEGREANFVVFFVVGWWLNRPLNVRLVGLLFACASLELDLHENKTINR